MKSKRETFGRKFTIQNKKIQETLDNLIKGWHEESYVFMEYKQKKVDKYNRIEQKFITPGNCKTCDIESIIENVEHNNNAGQPCTNLQPDKSVRLKNGVLQKLHRVAYVRTDDGRNICDFVRHVVKCRNRKIKKTIIKVGLDEGQETLKLRGAPSNSKLSQIVSSPSRKTYF